MKATVKAKDFRIPVDDMGKYLAFAQLKAQQTGQSVEYMTDSVVTGLGLPSHFLYWTTWDFPPQKSEGDCQNW